MGHKFRSDKDYLAGNQTPQLLNKFGEIYFLLCILDEKLMVYSHTKYKRSENCNILIERN